jgi:transposase
VVFTHGAGLDVPKKRVMACRITPAPTGHPAEGVVGVQAFGPLTVDLLALSGWLTAAGITPVAMESTGAYWKPVFNLLEGTMQVFLVNASHGKRGTGRKTDKADARGLAQRMRYGWLHGNIIPPAGHRDVREVTRYRTKLVQECRRAVNRAQGVLERATLKLASVAMDIRGVSGRAMWATIVEGRATPAVWADLAKGRLRSKSPRLLLVVIGNGKLVVPVESAIRRSDPQRPGGRAGTNCARCRACWTGVWRPHDGAAWSCPRRWSWPIVGLAI